MFTTTPTNADTSNLSEKRYVTVVVRMVIDQREQLVRGEIVDVNGIGQGQFAGWRGLINTLRDYLAKQQGRRRSHSGRRCDNRNG